MRFYLFGPRFLGIRPGISFQPNDIRAAMARSSMDAGMNAPTTYIYVVKATLPTEPSSMVKIGITTNLDARLAQLRTGSAFPLDYVFTAPAPFNSLDTDAYAIEQRAHALLARNRV